MDDKLAILKTLPFLKKKNIKSIKKLSGGLTNQSYLVKTTNDIVVCRFAPKNTTLLGLNKKREMYNTHLAANLGIGPKPLFFDVKNNLLIVSYLPGTYISKNKLHTKAFVSEFAQVLTRLHQSKTFKGLHDPWILIQKRIKFLKKRKSIIVDGLDDAYTCIQPFKKNLAQYGIVSSHVDLTYENILLCKKRIYFIDWEYSALSNPCIDIAMASIECDWTIKNEEFFISQYLSKKVISIHDLQIAKCLICMREASWGLVQYELTHNRRYFNYAKKRLKYFDKLIKKHLS